MNLLPYEKFELVLSESIHQVRKRLATHVEERSFWELFPSAGTRCFIGQLEGNSFKICRDIGYRKYFQPIICGTFAPHQAGTLISVRMRLHLPVIAFLVFLCWQAFSHPPFFFKSTGFWGNSLQLACIFGTPLLIVSAGFRHEADLSKESFLGIFRDIPVDRERERIS